MKISEEFENFLESKTFTKDQFKFEVIIIRNKFIIQFLKNVKIKLMFNNI